MSRHRIKSAAISFFNILLLLLFVSSASAQGLPDRSFEPILPGSEAFVSYERYGAFSQEGTEDYSYEVTDKAALSAAVGCGIHPDERYRQSRDFLDFVAANPAPIDPWKFSIEADPKKAYLAWLAAEGQDPGVRAFYLAEALRAGGLVEEAVKAYYSVLVHFPKTWMWSRTRRYYWYVAPEALARIRKLCATHPQLGYQLEGAWIDIVKTEKKDPVSDTLRVHPGRFIARDPGKRPDPGKIKSTRGQGRVRVAQYEDGSWQLLVEGKPFLVKGVNYVCTTVGESAHALNLRSWMRLDDDRNRKVDGMFDSWVDKNRNNRRDPDEPVEGDARLLKRMGANAIRIYHGVDAKGDYDPGEYNKPLMRHLHAKYGIHFIMGDFLGAYTVGSSANWNAGTDYGDEEQRLRMKRVVREMVLDHRSESYVLMWLLGNENQHPHTRTNADSHPEVYARFLNETARMIHELDPDHPVAVGNLNVEGLRELGKFSPEIDVYGANVYSGAYTMGSIWQQVKRQFDRPILFTEMGSDAYAEGVGVDEAAQAEYFEGNWKDIELNRSGRRGEGNAIGGVVFEWMDEWWKSGRGNSWGDPDQHNTDGDDQDAPFRDGWSHEEWFGIFGQGDGSQSHFLREPRAVYGSIRRQWTASPTRAEENR